MRLPLTPQRPEGNTATTLPGNVRKIVLLEDIPDAREMLAELLKLKGYEVQTADSGLAGLELIREQRPDVSQIDIGLPEIDGYEVVSRLRGDKETRSLFLVALTGYGQSSDREAVYQAVFDRHLVEPLNMDELDALLSFHSNNE
ncbi:MAG: response regulator [Pirellulaceae bacterium]